MTNTTPPKPTIRKKGKKIPIEERVAILEIAVEKIAEWCYSRFGELPL